MVRYIFKDDEQPILKNAKDADPQKIGEALAQLSVDGGGEIRTEVALAAASDKNHPCYKHLEWDNAVAGHKYRLDQMRSIIRSIRVVDTETHKPVHAFLSVSDRGGVSYRTIQDIKTSSRLRILVLERAEKALDAWTQRHADIADACKLVISAKSKVRRRRERLEERPD